MYDGLSNITLIVDTFEKILKLKHLEEAIKDIYALLHIFLIQLEVYQPFTLDVTVRSNLY